MLIKKYITNSFSSTTAPLSPWPSHLSYLNSLWKKLADKPVLYSDEGETLLYKELDHSSTSTSAAINLRYNHAQDHLNHFIHSIDLAGSKSYSKYNVNAVYSAQPRVGILCENGRHFITSLYGIWKSGCIAVPLCKLHPKEELEYVIRDSDVTSLITSKEYEDRGTELVRAVPGVEHIRAEECITESITTNEYRHGSNRLNGQEWDRLGGMLLYTSGTTGRPKGVLTTHENISAQLSMLVSSWKWAESDVILHCLPLHHLHGVLNALLCPLAVGASIVMLKKFDPKKVWQTLLGRSNGCRHPQVSLFMGVPTMYSKLIQYHNEHILSNREIKDHCTKNIRLMVSGSSALLDPVSHEWTSIIGHKLLERYGMTEIGMCLSNPYEGVRVPGHVGFPLPTVKVKVQPQEDDSNNDTKKTGTLLVKGPAVFKGYWNRLDETKETFTDDDWFITGDTVENTSSGFKILGRTSVDIIKSSGYKISALEIERVLLEHPDVRDCAVFGVTDEMLGEKIVAMVVLDPQNSTSDTKVDFLNEWCLQKLAHYKVPKAFLAIETIPRNVMGKINKKHLTHITSGK